MHHLCFFSLKKKNGQKSFIYTLCYETGAVLCETAEISQRAVKKKLYTCEYRKEQATEQIFLGGLRKVLQDLDAALSGAITREGLQKPLQSMGLW